ncbi:twin-arginine translocase subunit TatC [Blattabacterium cuenoti]|uniref:twin-arginine translocase subunit TatC n=1 Tax=Blattabacterium cuenoti TaxID=1653831 RepID=UPI00163C4D55|nr:twin-arginine translocase subunit TatC [Blattabacterium cuenoti]
MHNKKKEFPLWKHIEELRKHLIHCLCVIAICTIFLMYNKKIIFDQIIFGPAKKNFITYKIFYKIIKKIPLFPFIPVTFLSNDLEIQNRKIFGQFNMYMCTCIIGGIIISSPYIFYELWTFIKPGLSKKEEKYSKWMMISISFLFLLGIFFGYYILFPFLIHFGYSFKISNFPKNIFDLSDYISLIIHSVLSMGITFLFPFFIYLLTKMELISHIFLKKYRKYAFFIILIIASAITPGDIFSTIIVIIPLLFLYELSILISFYIKKNKE